MKVLLVRHAIAVDRDTPGLEDELRPLTEEGKELFRKTARAVSALVKADRVVSSPLLRARETAEILARRWSSAKRDESEALGSGSRTEFENELKRLPEKEVVAAVGHEPYLSEWTAAWLGARSGAAFAFKKGGVALIDFDGEVSKNAGRLVFFLAPAAMRDLSS